MPGYTPNRNLPYPLDTEKIGQGDDAIKALATALDAELIKVVPITQGGTGQIDKFQAKWAGLGITFGTGDPVGGAEGDIYFKLV